MSWNGSRTGSERALVNIFGKAGHGERRSAGHHTKDTEKWTARSVVISRAVRTRLGKTSCVSEFLRPPR